MKGRYSLKPFQRFGAKWAVWGSCFKKLFFFDVSKNEGEKKSVRNHLISIWFCIVLHFSVLCHGKVYWRRPQQENIYQWPPGKFIYLRLLFIIENFKKKKEYQRGTEFSSAFQRLAPSLWWFFFLQRSLGVVRISEKLHMHFYFCVIKGIWLDSLPITFVQHLSHAFAPPCSHPHHLFVCQPALDSSCSWWTSPPGCSGHSNFFKWAAEKKISKKLLFSDIDGWTGCMDSPHQL